MYVKASEKLAELLTEKKNLIDALQSGTISFEDFSSAIEINEKERMNLLIDMAKVDDYINENLDYMSSAERQKYQGLTKDFQDASNAYSSFVIDYNEIYDKLISDNEKTASIASVLDSLVGSKNGTVSLDEYSGKLQELYSVLDELQKSGVFTEAQILQIKMQFDDPATIKYDLYKALEKVKGELNGYDFTGISEIFKGKTIKDIQDFMQWLTSYSGDLSGIGVRDIFAIYVDSLNKLVTAIEPAKNALESLKKESDAVSKALKAQGYSGAIDLETYKSLVEMSEEYADALTYENGSLQLNAQKVNELIEEKAQLRYAELDIQQALSEALWASNTNQIKEYQKQLEGLSETDVVQKKLIEAKIQALTDENGTLEGNITQYMLMKQELLDMTDAYTKWLNVKESDNSNVMYNNILSAKKAIEEAIASGQTGVGNAVYQQAVELLVPDKQNVAEYMTTLKRYLTEDTSGLENFVSDSIEKGLLELDNGELKAKAGTTLQSFVDELKITPQMAKSIMSALSMYDGWNFEFASDDFHFDDDVAQNALDKIQITLDELGEQVDLNIGTSSVSEANSALQEIQTLLESITGTKNINLQVGSTKKGIADIISKISGSFSGSAHARGTIYAPGGKTLVGELGRELVVSNGRYYTVGEKGAEFVNLNPGDIVFSNDDTERILSGSPGGRGSALAGGNILVQKAAKSTKITGSSDYQALIDSLNKAKNPIVAAIRETAKHPMMLITGSSNFIKSIIIL